MFEDFLAALRAAGGRATNRRLLTALGWDRGDYLAIRETLLKRGVIRLAKGKGGSVILVGYDVT